MVEKTPAQVVIEAGGMGYLVRITAETFRRLPDTGAQCHLFLYHVVREDAMELFGFCTKEERQLFLNLMKVKGVGPHHALSVLSSAPLEEIYRAITAGDIKTLCRAKRVGKKLAQRIVLELKGELLLDETGDEKERTGPSADAEEALISLGYTEQEAAKAVSEALKEGEADTEELVRRALTKVR